MQFNCQSKTNIAKKETYGKIDQEKKTDLLVDMSETLEAYKN